MIRRLAEVGHQFADGIRGIWMGPYDTKDATLARLWGGPPSSTGIAVTETTALNYSAVWAAVSLIAGDVSSLPLILYKRRPDGGRERYTDSKLYRLLHDEPNPEMASMTFREAMTAHVLLWGNAYAEIERDGGGRPANLWPLSPDRVSPYREETSGRLIYKVKNPDGGDTILQPWQVLHIPGLGYDGICGYSVVTKARESIGLGVATERFGGTFFGQGSTFGGVLSHPGQLGPKAQKNLTDSLEARHQGVERAHRFLILEEGMKYERLGIPPNDAQFLETRKFQITEIARWFQVPPHKLADLERATFSNIEHQGLDYYKSCLRRWLIRWEQEINRKLIAPSERKIQFVEHLVDGLLRGDIKSRYEAYAIARQWGWLSVNRILESENMNPIGPEGDIHLVPINMAPADQINELVESQIEKNQKPQTTPTQPPPTVPQRDVELEALRNQLKAAETICEAAQVDLQHEQMRRKEAETRALVGAAELADMREREANASRRLDDATQERRDLTVKLEVLSDLQEQMKATHAQVESLPRWAPEAVTAPIEAAIASVGHGLGVELDSTRNKLAVAVKAATADIKESVAALPQMGPDDIAGIVAPVANAVGVAFIDLRAAVQQSAEDVKLAFAESEQASQERAQAIAADVASLPREYPSPVAPDLEPVRADVREITHRIEQMGQARDADALAADNAARQAAAARDAKVIAAHRAMLVDSVNRLLRIETDRARRAQATPEKLRKWMGEFYQTHRDVTAKTLEPILAAHLAWMESDRDPATVAQEWAASHVETSVRELRMALEADPEDVPSTLERTLHRWDVERAGQLADAVMREEIAYARRTAS